MKHKRQKLRRHPARVVLSDVLPYELPPSFSNRGLYDLIRATNLQIQPGGVYAKRSSDKTTDLLLGIVLGRKVSTFDAPQEGEPVKLANSSTPQDLKSIPMQYTVRHRVNDYRTLTVPHPLAQLDIAQFYQRFEDLIIYYTSRSKFSLRRPARVAPYVVTRDSLFESQLKSRHSVEIDSNEYEWLRSYFTYTRYSNVYKFYDSAEYRSCERRFGFLVKADIAKCFDSIYTHSISWAAHGHGVVKANLGKAMSGLFGDEFDRLMQRLNHMETSGITIGSESSRIFAEVILQSVDVEVETELSTKGLTFGEDYEVLRYVDDYFIFLADEGRRSLVLEILSRSLRKYKLHLNSTKEEGEHTPWLSPLTVAKSRVRTLIKRSTKRGTEDGETPTTPYVDASELIVGYKSILIDTGVSHLDLANYTLARVERALEKLVQRSQAETKATEITLSQVRSHQHQVTSALLALMDFVFFTYSGSPRMGPTVKVTRICSIVLQYARTQNIPAHDVERIEMHVRAEVLQQLRRSRGATTADAVTATLIDCISDLGSEHIIPESDLARICGFEQQPNETLRPPSTMNVLILFSILLHMKRSGDYAKLRHACENWIVDMQEKPLIDGELAILNLNVVTCPYVSRAIRTKVIDRYLTFDEQTADRLTSPSRRGNVDWESFNLYSALERKRMLEVY